MGDEKSVETKNSENKPKTTTYAGKKEDEMWLRNVTPNKDDQTEQEMYKLLVSNMGVFRWQNPHGFRSGQNRAIGQIKKKYSNIKEEALHNDYHRLSRDNWNQTLRKSKVFYNSWARQKIRTKYDGYFDDKVTAQRAKWKSGVEIALQEVLTLKLYTDFDKLQFALKRCFRFEIIDDSLKDNNDENNESKENEAEHTKKRQKMKRMRQMLEERIKQFY